MMQISIHNHMEGCIITLPPLTKQSYPVVPPQMLGGLPSVPHIHMVSQSSVGPPPSPTYETNSGGSISTSYTAYGSSPQNNPYFPFPSPL
jgi:hypothetical protein